MRKLAGMLVILLWNPLYAASEQMPLPLDKIGFQLSARQWVSTKTALLVVNLNATLSNTDLIKTRVDILDRLSKIAKGDWHITQFDRSQDNSGLEKLTVQAQARVDQASLTAVYENAKTVSKPGATYEIGSIDFKPSLEEMQAVRAQLRGQLYQQAYEELGRINKVYSGQNYTLFNLVFMEGDAMPQPKMLREGDMMMNAMAMPAAAAPQISVSNELIMTALVQAASNRQGLGNNSVGN